MSNSPRFLSVRAFAASACGLLLATVAGAQTQIPAPTPSARPVVEEEVITLSPFVVTTSRDLGYQADDTLAGAGLRTPLNDVGSAISVITPKFFEDTGSTDLRDVLVYQAGTETSGLGGNFSGATVAGSNIANDTALSNTVGTRVRGLATATLSRNFFRALLPVDAYNSGRLDINRGANALLFGVGSPAGIINYTTQEAFLGKSSGEATVSTDNFGSFRQSVNFNHVIIPKVAALRLAGVNDDERYRQEPAFNDDQRLYGALTLRIPKFERGIFSDTTIKANGEWGRINANNPRTLPPGDRVSGWFADTIPAEFTAVGIAPQITYDAFKPLPTPPIGLTVMQNTNRSPVVIFSDPNNSTPGDPVGSVNGQPVLGRPFVSNNYLFTSTNTSGTAGQLATGFYNDLLSRAGFPDASQYFNRTINDPRIFDYNNLLLDGPNKSERNRFRARTFSLEQLFLDGRAGVELAYDSQNSIESRRSLLPTEAVWIAIDVNSRMWDGTTNPNFGRPFTGGLGQGDYSASELATKRVKAFYELDFARHTDSRWGKILGKHVLSLLGQEESFERDVRFGRLNAVEGTWTNGNNQDRQSDLGKTLTTLNYLSPSLAGASAPRGIGAINADRLDLLPIVNNGVFLVRTPAPNAASASLPQHAIRYEPVTFVTADEALRGMASAATKTHRDLKSEAVALQSNLLDNTIATTFGWRKERVETERIDAPLATTGENYRLVDDPRYDFGQPGAQQQVFEKTLRSWSTVAKVPEKWVKRIPFVSGLNFYYGKSENFDPPESTSVNVFGRTLEPASGDTLDYGVMISLFNDRLTFRVNRYETNQVGVLNTGLSGAANQILTTHQLAFNSVLANLNPDANGDRFPDGYVAPPQALLDLYKVNITGNTLTFTNPGVVDTSDFSAKGEEFEMQLKPTRGLTLVLNAARQESVRTNSGAALRQLLFDTPLANGKTLAEEWRSATADSIALFAGGVPGTSSQLKGTFERNVLNPYNNVVVRDGAPASELREWRVNFIANYDFKQARLKGWSVGGAARWEDRAAIGFPLITLEADGSPSDNVVEVSDLRVSDVKRPYYGPDELTFDGWVSYSRKIFHGKIDLKVQLNCRNIEGKNDLVPVAAQPNGDIAVSRIAQPRTFTLSTKFGF